MKNAPLLVAPTNGSTLAEADQAISRVVVGLADIDPSLASPPIVDARASRRLNAFVALARKVEWSARDQRAQLWERLRPSLHVVRT